MSNLVSVRRVTVVVESELEKMLVEQFAKLGARGYTCVDCRGRGEHEIAIDDDPFVNAGRVRIETIVQPKVAADILNYLESPQFAARAIAACVEAVEVSAADRI
ncbi:MAG TPA: hypothetical protein VKU82_08950 [Planctomycetaceae bacterium]|nr:hypothetical protein [Planctomycetaceae bacterium]